MTRFRSDSDPDFACLEQYLASGTFGTLTDFSLHQSEQNLPEVILLLEEFAKDMPWASDEANGVIQKLSENKVELPTRYDSPSQYLILEKLVGRVREAARSLQFQTEYFPHFACIPTGLVNASAVSLPCSSRPFLLFDSQLLLYCHLFAKTFANCLPIVGREGMTSFSTDTKLVIERIESKPEIVERLNELLHAYVVAGSPQKSTQYHPHNDYVHLIDILRDGMEIFVVAHEFGHVHSGHLGPFLQRLQVKSEVFASGNDNHRQEHEADVVGLILTLKAMADSGYDAALSYIGIELFFISMEMASRSEHIFRFGHDDDYRDSASVSHPANSDRRSVLNAALEIFIESNEQVDGARSISAKYNEISGILWKYAQAANPSSRLANPD